MKKRIKHAALRLVDRVLGNTLEPLIVRLITTRATRLPAADGLRFMFRMNAALYPLLGRLSVAYGGGLHTKHKHMRYHDFFVERIASSERVLDIGCGIGKLAFEVAERSGATVVGVDLVAANIKIAEQRFSHERVTFKIADATEEMEDGPFDVVILSNVLEHLNDRTEFLKRVRAAVTPKRFLIRVPLFERDWQVPLKKELGVEWRLDLDHKIEYRPEELIAELSEAGLRITHQEVRWGEIWVDSVANA